MKKFLSQILALSLVLTAGLSLDAKPKSEVDQLYAKYKGCKNAVEQTIGSFMINMLQLAMREEADEIEEDIKNAKDTTEAKEMKQVIKLMSMPGLKKIEMLTLDKCSENDRQNFISDVTACKFAGYTVTGTESCTDTTDNSPNAQPFKTKMLVAHDGKYYNEIISISYGGSNKIMKMSGKFAKEDLAEFINSTK